MNHVFLIYRWLFALDALHRIFIGDAPGSQHHDADNDDQQQQRQPDEVQHTDIDLPGKLREPLRTHIPGHHRMLVIQYSNIPKLPLRGELRGLHILRIRHHASVEQVHRAMGKGGIVLRVCHHDDGRAFLVQFGQEVHHLGAVLRIEVTCRLVR